MQAKGRLAAEMAITGINEDKARERAELMYHHSDQAGSILMKYEQSGHRSLTVIGK
jgi:hypothetical protein